jgi:hypothetical protein
MEQKAPHAIKPAIHFKPALLIDCSPASALIPASNSVDRRCLLVLRASPAGAPDETLPLS